MTFENILKKNREKYFPMELVSSFSAHLVQREEFDIFLKENFAKVFKPQKNRLHIRPNPSKKEAALRESYFESIHNELILIRDGQGKIVGWCMGEAFDSKTFYMRNTGILPRFQGQGIYSAFLSQLIAYLKSLGYQRVNSQHHPDNPAVLIPKLKNGFIITGLEAREEWGLLVVMTKLLSPTRDNGWKQKFL